MVAKIKYRDSFQGPSTASDGHKAIKLSGNDVGIINHIRCAYYRCNICLSQAELLNLSGWQKIRKEGKAFYFCCGGHYVTWAEDQSAAQYKKDGHAAEICDYSNCQEKALVEWVRRTGAEYTFYCSMGHRDGINETITVVADPIAGVHYHKLFRGQPIDCYAIIRLYSLEYFKGTALAYLLRAGQKADTPELTDIRKAIRTLEDYADYLENGEI